MRRIASVAVLLLAMSVNISVFADGDEFTEPADYTGNTGNSATSYSATVNTSGCSTVLITNENGSIVYVDQADDVYRASEKFLLQNSPAIGKYTVRLGSESGTPQETYFYVGVSGNTDDLCMKRLQSEESNGALNDSDTTWKIGYYATIDLADYNYYTYLKVGYLDNETPTYGTIRFNENWEDSTNYSGEGSANLIFQLNDVPNDYKDSVAVYLIKDEISSSQGGG